MTKTDKIISFDLQGTISNGAFSDEFWLTLLPKIYAEKYQVSLEDAKHNLRVEQHNRYDKKYYDHRYWMQTLVPTWKDEDLFAKLINSPKLFTPLIKLIQTIDAPVILCSATTYSFIYRELGEKMNLFYKVYSSIDNFSIPGKPPTFYDNIAKELNRNPKNFLHIGDCIEMDIQNSKMAGWDAYHWSDKNRNVTRLKEKIKDFLSK